MEKSDDKPHGNDCSCRPCNMRASVEEMADRVGAYKSAQALLKESNYPEDMVPSPHETLVLANWLYYGGGDDDD